MDRFTVKGNAKLPVLDGNGLKTVLTNARRLVAEKQSTVQRVIGEL